MKRPISNVAVLIVVCGIGLGAPRAVIAQSGPDEIGAWDPVVTWAVNPTHVIALKNGKLLVLADHGSTAPTPCVLFDPSNDTVSVVFETPENPTVPGDAQHNLFCTGHSALADGRILFTGGEFLFEDKVTIYDPDLGATTGAFHVLGEDSPQRRFYPTLTTLADGRILAMAGHSNFDPTGGANTPAVFEMKQPGQQWGSLVQATYCDDSLQCATNIFHFHWWPFMFQLSNGLVAYAGEGEQHILLSQPPELPIESHTLDVATEAWTDFPNETPPTITVGTDEWAVGGSAVMYSPDRIMKAGGLADQVKTDKAYRLDASSNQNDWVMLDDMTRARLESYLMVLPDASVLAIGGVAGEPETAALVPELMIDPDAPGAVWTDMAPMDPDYGRGRHSVAILLSDARVLVAGGDQSGPMCPDPDPAVANCGRSAQIFNPPYLFDAQGAPLGNNRPKITAVNSQQNNDKAMYYGQQDVTITLNPGLQGVVANAKVSLIRPGAATHAFDQSQRFMNLEIVSAASDSLTVGARGDPADPGVLNA